MTRAQTLKAADLRPLRDRIAQEIQVILGTDPDAALDSVAAKTLLQKLITTLKGI
jgi:ABC-type phosphate/phosphonate transport system ATPase subunit